MRISPCRERLAPSVLRASSRFFSSAYAQCLPAPIMPPLGNGDDSSLQFHSFGDLLSEPVALDGDPLDIDARGCGISMPERPLIPWQSSSALLAFYQIFAPEPSGAYLLQLKVSPEGVAGDSVWHEYALIEA